MDARVCLSDIDPTDANATRLVLGRRGDGGGGGGFMEAGIWKFLKPVARAARWIRASSPSQFSQT